MPILTTKLNIPPPRPQMVPRPRLIEQLNQGLHGKLTLISAPAGFGKTTLVSNWVADGGQSVAWLSLDAGDSDPARFLTYLVAALQTIAPHLGEGMAGVLQPPQPPPIEALMTPLLNQISALAEGIVLVLDDYHAIDHPAVHQAVTFLLEHMPPQMRLLIASREDPPLPLARLRVRSQMTELRAADLRFTPDEAAGFLNQVMGLNLSPENIAALEMRTEGWIAGLQLAALSMQGQSDPRAFIDSFTGSHHFVLDYLVEEVLHQQPADVQTFLMRTSILDRLCGPLCAAVLDDPAVSGQAMLESLDRANLFLVPLDHDRRWYRYHHLFADLLRQRLQADATTRPEDVAALHQRASQWYEDQGLVLEAFQHAAAAHDVARAERLLEGEGVPLYFQGVMNPILHWLESLPTPTLDARPGLWVTYATVLTFLGEPAPHVEEKLRAAETILNDAEPDRRNRDLIGQIAALRAMLAIPTNQVDTLITQSRRALAYLDPDNLPVRTATTWTLGYAYQTLGDRAEAIQAYTDTLSISQPSGNLMNTLAAATCLGQVQESENHLHQAAEHYRQVLHLVGDPPPPYACEAYLGLARLFYQWNDLAAAEQYGQEGVQLAQQLSNVDTPAVGWLLLARVKQAQGDASGAAVMHAAAETFVRQRNFAHLLPELAAAQVLALLEQANLTAAARLVEQYDLPLSQARVHLAQGDPAAALALLETLHQQAEARNWADERLRVRILQALSYQTQGDLANALPALEAAFLLAAPSGFIRIFVDEGPPMRDLLSEAAARGVLPNYTRKLLTAFQVGVAPASQPVAQPLVEPLSDRELEILGLVAEGLSNREISERLFLALSTVKGHNRNIFDKLQTKNRTETVARARELGLL